MKDDRITQLKHCKQRAFIVNNFITLTKVEQYMRTSLLITVTPFIRSPPFSAFIIGCILHYLHLPFWITTLC